MKRPPRDVGNRLLPVVLDHLARDEPDHVLYVIPRSERLEDGLLDISARTVANAVNRTSHWLAKEIGRGTSFPTVAYVGPQDLRYLLLTVACVKTGHKLLLLSPRNTIDGQLGVMAATECKTIVLPQQHAESLDVVVEKGELQMVVIPDQTELLNGEIVEHFEYPMKYKDVWHDPFYVVHTSGTTGVPKPIVCTHGHQASWDYHTWAPRGEDGSEPRHKPVWDKRIFNTAPLFHQLGFVFCITTPIWNHCTSILGPANEPPSLASVGAILAQTDVDGIFLPPPLVDAIARHPPSLERLKRVEFIATGGGPVSEAGGISVASVTDLRNVIGSSETLLLQSYETKDPRDWKYFRWHPWAGVVMKNVAPDLYEQWIVRVPNHSMHQPIFHVFPQLDEYNTRDLFRRHPGPNKADYWCFSGRSDDIVVLGNGEKIQPLDMEGIINDHPAVSGSLVVGTGRLQAAVLVELKGPPPSSAVERAALIDSLWEHIQRANTIAPSHARISRNFIMLSDPKKPFVRADKGSIKRLVTVELYENEIDVFYAGGEDHEAEETLEGGDFATVESTNIAIRRLLEKIMKTAKLQDQDNLFVAGLDSLMVLQILGALRSVIKNRDGEPAGLRPTFVYTNSTVASLAKAFHGLIHSDNGDQEPNNTQSMIYAVSINSSKTMLQKYSTSLAPNMTDIGVGVNHCKATVVLTGSTGSLGSYLLEALASNSSVEKVICFNRTDDAKARLAKSAPARGLTPEWHHDKVQFLKADMSHPYFGFSEQFYKGLLGTTTHIVHNAWPVNFNWPIDAFEPHILGLKNLIDFTSLCVFNPRLLFVSSVGAVAKCKANDFVPEAIVEDISASEGTGYGSSKQVSEILLAKAVDKLDLKVTICRIGQIAGPVMRGQKGCWNKQEWFPLIISASARLGLIPSDLAGMNRVDWVPVDILANILVDYIHPDRFLNAELQRKHEKLPNLEVYNVVNPRSIPWEELIDSVSSVLGDCKVVPWSTWIQELRDSDINPGSAAARDNPALKLVDFFSLMTNKSGDRAKAPALSTDRAVSQSKMLSEMEAVSPKWMELWLKQWGFQ